MVYFNLQFQFYRPQFIKLSSALESLFDLKLWDVIISHADYNLCKPVTSVVKYLQMEHLLINKNGLL